MDEVAFDTARAEFERRIIAEEDMIRKERAIGHREERSRIRRDIVEYMLNRARSRDVDSDMVVELLAIVDN